MTQPLGGRSRLGSRLPPLPHWDQPALEGSPETMATAHRPKKEQRQKIFLRKASGARAITVETATVVTLEPFAGHALYLLVSGRKNLAAIITERPPVRYLIDLRDGG